jgi:Zn-dependent peptidase ImmA (M78 family)
LCQHLELPLISLSELKAEPQHLAYYLTGPGRPNFSAVTLLSQGKRWVIHNDAHELGRQASNIAHEIAHALLHHPVPALFDANGQRSHNREHEEEANWLGPALLISEEAALFIVRSRMSIEDAAEHYGTSKDIIQMRLNVNGARSRVA